MGNEARKEGCNPADRRTKLARDRTDWARERTMLAKQRTFTAWVRTGLAALAAGIAGARLLEELEPQWLTRSLGAALIAISAVIFVLGFLNYRKTFRKLRDAGMVSYRVWVVGMISVALVLSSAAGLALIFLN
jgi:putative membrane protein